MNLEAGQKFPDLDLPDHTGRPRRLSELAGGDPVALLFSRGWWCPKEQRHLREVTALQNEFEVAYARIVVVLVLGTPDDGGPTPGHARDLPGRARGLPALMGDLPDGAAHLTFDGQQLLVGRGPGRCLMIDARCVHGVAVRGAYAHVCALTDPRAALAFDQPEVQQVRRDALAWWIGLLGDALICLTTLAVDEARYAGAITVTRQPAPWSEDPFARIFPGTVVRSGHFCPVAPPPGSVLERYAGVAWPGGTFMDWSGGGQGNPARPRA